MRLFFISIFILYSIYAQINQFSLGDNLGYTNWQTAGAEGDIDLFCQDSSIVVGYEGRTGAWMDRFRLICKHLNTDGTLGELSYTDYNGGSEGGADFGPFILADDKGLVGVSVNISTWYTSYMASIQGFGHNIVDIATSIENNENNTSMPFLGPTGNQVMNIGTEWAQNGHVIVGMQVPSQTGYTQGVRWIYRDLLLNAGPEIEGDVNNDGIINLIDILIIVNIILNFEEYDLFADVNGDSQITVVDVITLISIILGA